MAYIFSKFSLLDEVGIRLGGPGLGNLLFPYARAVIFSKNYNLKLINPTWPSLKIGPWIRFEKDKRFYANLFNDQGISGLQKSILLLNKKMNESVLSKTDIKLSNKDIIICNGLKNYFLDIINDYDTIKQNILNSAKQNILKIYNTNEIDGIGLHLRMGDFTQEARNDINWCIQIIENIRKISGKSNNVYLFSDGSDLELKALLELPNVKRAFFGSSLADILVLSKSKLLIASDSTFSGWSAYLGRMPVIFPKCHFKTVYGDTQDSEFILPNPDDIFQHLTTIKNVLN